MPRIPSPSLYRFHRDDFVSLNYAASAAPTTYIRAIVGVRYDDGSTDEFVILVNSFTTDRTILTTYVGTNQFTLGPEKMRDSGFIEYASVFQGIAGGLKRGQFYVSLNLAGRGDYDHHVLAAGYIYELHGVALGTIIEPGPGGGEGDLREITVAASNVVAAGVSLVSVPTNAVWKVHAVHILYTATGATGTRDVRISTRRAATNTVFQFVARAPTASQTARWWLVVGGAQTPETSARSTGNIQAVEGFWPRLMTETDDLFVDDAADIDVTTPFDTAEIVSMTVEEWIVP